VEFNKALFLPQLSCHHGKLLYALEDRGAGISLCNLYLGGTAHADEVCAISTSTNGAIEQSHIISDFTNDNEPFLNQTKTEVVRFSINSDTHDEHIQIVDSTAPVLSPTKWLGYHWSKTLSPKLAVEENVKKAMKQFWQSNWVNKYS